MTMVHSMETLNTLLSDTILVAMDKKQVTALVLLDVSKAFNSLDYILLLEILRSLGLAEATLYWFRCCLTDRTHVQSVCFGCELSELHQITQEYPKFRFSVMLCSIFT